MRVHADLNRRQGEASGASHLCRCHGSGCKSQLALRACSKKSCDRLGAAEGQRSAASNCRESGPASTRCAALCSNAAMLGINQIDADRHPKVLHISIASGQLKLIHNP